ncbi:MAG TPA: hypothetical protein DCO77_12465 [Nitrospiraceae bacterium]|nr:hypothetical protein [Nitrospiraceae bacterium]
MVEKRRHIAPIIAAVTLCHIFVFFQSPPAFGQSAEPTDPKKPLEKEKQTIQVEPPVPDGREIPNAKPVEETTKKPADTEEEGITDTVHGTISRRVLSSARWLDSFFDDERFAAEDNRTRIKVRIDTFLEDEAPAEVKTRTSLQLSLPRLKNRGRLIISGDPDEGTDEPDTPGETITDRVTGDEARNVTASFLYDLRSTAKRNVRLRAGVRYRDGSPVVFLAPRYRQLFDLGQWDLRFTEEVRWYTDIGWQSGTRFDLERQFRKNLFFRTSADGFWTEEENGYFYSLSFYLRQPLSRRQAVEYEWNNYFQTRPENVLEEVVLRVRYRQRIWRDWLFYELAPQFKFTRERDFAMIPGILFRIEMIFGWLKEEKG